MRNNFIFLKCFLLSLFFSSEIYAEDRVSLSFSASDKQYMKIDSHDDFNIKTSESFTISLWIKAPSYQKDARLVNKRVWVAENQPYRSGYEIWLGASYNQFLAVNIPGMNTGNVLSAYSSSYGYTNNWYHFALVFNRDYNTVKMYQDGTQVGSASLPTDFVIDNSHDVIVGANNKGAGTFANYFTGEISALRFYKKALSYAEVTTDKNAETVDQNTAGLVAAYDFKSIKGTSVPDISGHNHNGTLVNFPVVSKGLTISSVAQTAKTDFSGRGNQNEQVLKLAVTTQGNESATLNSITINMDGTTSCDDVTTIKVYSTDSSDNFDSRTLSRATLVGTTTPGAGNITCSISNCSLGAGTQYLWITYDLSETATEGNTIKANVTNLTTEAESYTVSSTSGSIGSTILLGRKLLFAPGDLSSKFYRIPGIITAKDGSLVAVSDKRKYDNGDLPQDIDVLLVRSTDNGKTWSSALTLAEGKGARKGYGDAALVRTNEENGLLCLFAGGEGIFNNSTPSNPTRTYVCKSLDNGLTWSQPKDITDQIYGSGCSNTTRKYWYTSFCASGNGLLTSTGRIMFVAAVRETSSNTLSNFAIYSDDNGETWNVSNRAKQDGDEAKVVELNDGTILMSIRRTNSGGARYYSKSTDNGVNWSYVSNWNDLIEPKCNGDIIRYTSTNNGYEKNRLLHSIPNNSTERKNVSVFVSYDEGLTWPVSRSICPTGSAYSSLCILKDGTIGALVEENMGGGDYSIYFTNFSLDWLSNGQDTYKPNIIKPAESPQFNIPEGEYAEAFELSLTSQTEDATIYYTLDGTTPNKTSSVFDKDELIYINATTTVKAIATMTGMADSEIAAAEYTLSTNDNFCIWNGADRKYPDERRLVSLAITGATKKSESLNTQTVTNTSESYSKVYVDRLSTIITATPGDTIIVSPTHIDLSWIYGYIYVDYDQDGTFNTTNELVSFSYADGKDSHGNKGNMWGIPENMPSFPIPTTAKPGKTRMRFKIDCDTFNPCGSADIANNSGTIMDFTIDIQRVKYNINISSVVEGGSFVIKHNDDIIENGTPIYSGSKLTVETTPNENYILKAIKVNDQAIEGNSFVVSGNSTVSVEFVKQYTISYTSPEGCTIVVEQDGITVENGSKVTEGSELSVVVTPDESYTVKALKINDVTLEESNFTVTEDATITVELTKNYTVTYNSPKGCSIIVKQNDVTIANGSKVPEGSDLTVIVTLDKFYYLDAIKVNDVVLDGTTFVVEQNSTISVDITRKHSVTYSSTEGGTISVMANDENIPNNSKVVYGTVLSISIAPEEEYKISYLTINGGTYLTLEKDQITTHTVDEDVTISAVFEPITELHETSGDNIHTYFNNNNEIIVNGVKEGDQITVLDEMGHTLVSTYANNEMVTIPAAGSHLYFVRIATKKAVVVNKMIK